MMYNRVITILYIKILPLNAISLLKMKNYLLKQIIYKIKSKVKILIENYDN